MDSGADLANLANETASGRAVRNKNRSRLPAPSQARLPFASSLLAVFPHYPSHEQPHKQEERCDSRSLIHKPSAQAIRLPATLTLIG